MVRSSPVLPFVWGNTHELHEDTHTHTHARTTIVIHSTVRFDVSHPVSTVGSCPNKGDLHSSLCTSHASLIQADTNSDPIRTLQSDHWQSATYTDNVQRWPEMISSGFLGDLCNVKNSLKHYDFTKRWQIFATIPKSTKSATYQYLFLYTLGLFTRLHSNHLTDFKNVWRRRGDGPRGEKTNIFWCGSK